MIPVTGVEAVYRFEGPNGKDYFVEQPVVAVDANGEAYILADCVIMPAHTRSGFHALRNVDHCQIIPGGGWMITFVDGQDETYTKPVVGWAINSAGHGRVLETDDEGTVQPVEGSSYRIWHPDCVPSWKPEGSE